MPYPLTDGGNIGIYNITKHLAALGHEITLVTFPLASLSDTEKAIKDISRFADIRVVSRSLPSRWKVLARTVFRGAYPIERRMTREMFSLLRKIVGTKAYDIVHVDHAHMGRYGLWLQNEFQLPAILREHNYESLIYERFAATEPNILKSLVARVHGKRLKIEEAGFLSKFDAVAAISDEDAKLMRLIAPSSKLTVIPAGADTYYFTPLNQKPDSNRLLFVGTLAWDPNFDSLRYFLREILPLILKARPNTVLDIVGSEGHRILPYSKDFGSSVIVNGQVPDIRDYLARAAVVVVPLRIGGGMRVKLLEFFAAGKAIVSTSVGAEGNIAEDSKHLLLRDDSLAFAEAVLQLLASPNDRKSLGENARALACSEYSWEKISMRFVQLYQEVLSASANPRMV